MDPNELLERPFTMGKIAMVCIKPTWPPIFPNEKLLGVSPGIHPPAFSLYKRTISANIKTMKVRLLDTPENKRDCRTFTIGKVYEGTLLRQYGQDYYSVKDDVGITTTLWIERFEVVKEKDAGDLTTNQFQNVILEKKQPTTKQMKVNFPTRTRHVAALNVPAPLKLRNGSLYKVTVDGNSVIARLHEKVRAKLDGTQYYVFSVHKKPFLATEDEIAPATKNEVNAYLSGL